MNSFLFVYGSLLAKDNEFANYLRQHADYIIEATFTGRLYDIGEYPGAILGDSGYDIHGAIYKISNPATAFTVLDEYEGFGETEEQPNLFLRRIIEATTQTNKFECWVYLYNLPTKGLTEITTGNYLS